MQVTRKRKKYTFRQGEKETLRVCERKNCEISGGQLRSGVGVKTVPAFEGGEFDEFLAQNTVKALWVGAERGRHASYPLFAALNGEGILSFYGGESEGLLTTCDMKFSPNSFFTSVFSEGIAFKLAVHSNGKIYTVKKDGEAVLCYNGVESNLGVFLHGRLYHAGEYELRFTAPYDYQPLQTDGDNAGMILADRDYGKIVAMIAYGERLFVLQEYGAFFVEGGGSSRDFVVKRVPRLGGKAVFGGACLVGEEIVYLCEDGVYKRKENAGSLLSKEVGEVDFSAPLNATASEGRYRLAYRNKKGEERVRIFNGESGDAYESFCLQAPCGREVTFGISGGKLVQLCLGGALPEGEERFIRFLPEDFGKSSEKTLRRICIAGRGVLETTVRSERGFRRFKLELIKGGEVEFALKGRSFEVELSLGADTCVEEIEAEYEEAEVNEREY